MSGRLKWVFLVYRLPRQPSTPRIALWRRLRRLGVVQVTDGVVALPLDARTKEQLEWLAEGVVEDGGEATIWVAEAGSAAQERALAGRMAEAVAEEYRAVIAAAGVAARERPAARRRTFRRLRRELRAIRARDFFPPAEATEARRVVEELAEALEASA
ncbi:MAG TPA: Chromate resistance protein ChrB [Acidimicrobiia bacterium]|nr:Chromate resistance protein ChrB [Acidimicrobiia bacterium]